MTTIARFQIGKNGLSPDFPETVISAFKTRRQVRISVLKSAPRDKENLVSYANEIQKNLPFKTRLRIIGFTIILSK